MSIKQMLKETADEVEVEGPCTVFSGRCTEILPASELSSIFHSGWVVCSSMRYRKKDLLTLSLWYLLLEVLHFSNALLLIKFSSFCSCSSASLMISVCPWKVNSIASVHNKGKDRHSVLFFELQAILITYLLKGRKFRTEKQQLT